MGSDHKQAKYSSRLLCYMKEKGDLRAEVVEVGLLLTVWGYLADWLLGD